MNSSVLAPAVYISLSFLFVAVVLLVTLHHQRHQRKMLSAERLAAIEKGQVLPPETFLDPDGRRHRRAGNSLRTGIITVGFGLGSVASLLAVKPNQALWGWGLLLIAVGVAHLIYWFVRGRVEWDAAQELEHEKRRAWLAQVPSVASPPSDAQSVG